VNIVAQRQNAATAFLTGAVAVEGDLMHAARLDKYRR
jgi:putative sterol carrier protein